MATQYATGVDGSITLTGIAGYRVDFWSATFSQVVVNITGFDSSGWAEFQGGLKSGRGSFAGTPKYNAATSAPWFKTVLTTGVSAVFTVATGCTFTGKIVISDESFSVDVNGASRITANFVFSETITVAWDETP